MKLMFKDNDNEINETVVPVIEADPDQGLTEQQVEERRAAGLLNVTDDPHPRTLGSIVVKNVFTYFNLVFCILAAAVIAVKAWFNLAFMVVVVVNTIVGIVQEYKSKKKLDGLKILSSPKARVLREGIEREIPADETVRDDIVVFGAGDQIYADALVVDGVCSVNESLLTGESDDVQKNKGTTLMSGSFVVSGTCKARLSAVGNDSYVSGLTDRAKKNKGKVKSQMMLSLDRLVMAIGIIIIPLGIAMAYKEINILHNSVRDGVVSTVASLVGMIPEGLYLLTSAALLTGAVRLAGKKTVVHDMGCIETLARVDVLCVDKTGTITEPEMTVSGIAPFGDNTEDQLAALLADCINALSSDNQTIKALKTAFPADNPRPAQAVLPFSSQRKFSGVQLETAGSYLIGAPENILRDSYENIRPDVEKHSARGCRVLLLASLPVRLRDAAKDPSGISCACPLGLVLLENRIRPNAKETFNYFAHEGVAVKVISGDNPVTVSSVAGQAGIIGYENYIDARTLPEDDSLFAEAAEKYTVFGRVTPDQKQRLVKALQSKGHKVAMTGDGVNDILALKEADCSVAMASGSQAACQVSHIVLLESDFSVMPSVVAEGRRVINNIERSAALYLVKNIFSLCLSLISLVFTFAYPFSAVQMSLISDITIGLPSIALALEPSINRIRGRFMSNVIYRALPSALSDLVLTIGVVLFYSVFPLEETEMSSICTLLIGLVGLLMIHRTCKPYNNFRKIILAVCCAAFVFSITVLSPIYSVSLVMSKGAWLILTVFALLAFEVSISANIIVESIHDAVVKITAWIEKKRNGVKDNA